MKNLIFGLLISGLGLGALSCTTAESTESGNVAVEEASVLNGGQATVNDDVSQKDIVKVAISSPDHTTLVKAVQAADLVNSLANAGPFTVFAPTNEAFDQLPAGTVKKLLEPESKDDLSEILQYHVTVSAYDIDRLYDGQVLGQVNSKNITIHVKDGKTFVNDAAILASVKASNGVVHVIDKVLLPQ